MGNDQPRRKALPSTPLQLKRFWLEEFRIQAEQGWEGPIDSSDVPLNGRIEVAPLEGGDGSLVRLNIRTKAVRRPIPYRLQMTIGGVFSTIDDVPADRRERLVRLNGTSILYGIARGLVGSVSGIGPNGPLTLPPVNFVRFFEGSPDA